VNHYDVLGVSRDATSAQIRSAFRRLARAHHPDTSATGSADKLAPINEAWRVLGDQDLRRAYDRSLIAASAPPSPVDDWSPSPSPTLTPLPPSNFPWRFLLGLAVVGIGIVLLGVFTYTPSKQGPPDNVLEPGSCVVIEDNGDAAEVNCDTDHDGVVDNRIGADELCAPPMEPHRDKQGLGVYCIRLDV
jgi:molecular chaperone DnaJ